MRFAARHLVPVEEVGRSKARALEISALSMRFAARFGCGATQTKAATGKLLLENLLLA